MEARYNYGFFIQAYFIFKTWVILKPSKKSKKKSICFDNTTTYWSPKIEPVINSEKPSSNKYKDSRNTKPKSNAEQFRLCPPAQSAPNIEIKYQDWLSNCKNRKKKGSMQSQPTKPSPKIWPRQWCPNLEKWRGKIMKKDTKSFQINMMILTYKT